MAILNIFKKKKKEEKQPAAAPALKIEKKEEKTKAAKKEIRKETEAKPLKKETRFKDAYRILKSPVITEKATLLAENNQYIFEVEERANKTEIKKAIKSVYGVEVLSVNIINIPRKARIVGRKKGWKKGYKKAIVKIKQGQQIEILPR